MIKEIPVAKVDTMELDFSSLASVKKFASDFKSSGRPLNLLINNVGIMATPFMLSKDKIELQFSTNHLATAAMVHMAKSKLANILQANELTRRLKGFFWRICSHAANSQI